MKFIIDTLAATERSTTLEKANMSDFYIPVPFIEAIKCFSHHFYILIINMKIEELSLSVAFLTPSVLRTLDIYLRLHYYITYIFI